MLFLGAFATFVKPGESTFAIEQAPRNGASIMACFMIANNMGGFVTVAVLPEFVDTYGIEDVTEYVALGVAILTGPLLLMAAWRLLTQRSEAKKNEEVPDIAVEKPLRWSIHEEEEVSDDEGYEDERVYDLETEIAEAIRQAIHGPTGQTETTPLKTPDLAATMDQSLAMYDSLRNITRGKSAMRQSIFQPLAMSVSRL